MILCIDLGATNIKVALFDETKQQPLAQVVKQIPTDAHKGKSGILAALDKAVELRGSAEVVALSSAGNIDSEAKILTYATDNLPGMSGFDYGKFFAERKLRAEVLNDAHAALLGEMTFGAGKNITQKKVAMLTLGSGVGGGYWANGKIVSDQSNDYARYGHIALHRQGVCTCGKTGCAEIYLSGRAIHRRLPHYGLGNDVFDKLLRGDSAANAFVDDFCADFNLLLDKMQAVNAFDECIVGGGVVEWMGQAFSVVADRLRYPVVAAVLGNKAGLYGAFAFACDKIRAEKSSENKL